MIQVEMFEGDAHEIEHGELLESEIQEKCVEHARNSYRAYARKFSSPANRSVPDYIFTVPLGAESFTWYVEFKKKGKTPTKAQAEDHAKIIEAGGVVWDIDDVDEFKRRMAWMRKHDTLYR